MNRIQKLIERYQSDEELPQTGPFRSTKDTVSFQACREIETLNDPSLVPELKEISKPSSNWTLVKDLAYITGCLVYSTNDQAAKNFYLTIRRKRAKSSTIRALVSGATRGKIEEYESAVREMMAVEVRTDKHYHACLKYLGVVLGESSVEELGSVLQNDCWGRCSPMYACIALGYTRSKKAIPYLEAAAKKNEKGLKRDVIDTHHFAMGAIEKIESNNESLTLNDVRMFLKANLSSQSVPVKERKRSPPALSVRNSK